MSPMSNFSSILACKIFEPSRMHPGPINNKLVTTKAQRSDAPSSGLSQQVMARETIPTKTRTKMNPPIIAARYSTFASGMGSPLLPSCIKTRPNATKLKKRKQGVATMRRQRPAVQKVRTTVSQFTRFLNLPRLTGDGYVDSRSFSWIVPANGVVSVVI
ncbi:hypothetical protein DL96DRAFT_1635710 [Flagelloscypha sp. PMI_526]|nr:hypothetical protein DL96DRAFT_1635710 [Flagelloscypha sp. PMI_526]